MHKVVSSKWAKHRFWGNYPRCCEREALSHLVVASVAKLWDCDVKTKKCWEASLGTDRSCKLCRRRTSLLLFAAAVLDFKSSSMRRVFGASVDELFMLLLFRSCTPHTHARCVNSHTLQQQLMGATKHKGCNLDTGTMI